MSLPTVGNWGPLVIETDVDLAVVTTLKLWMPTVLTAIEAERGLQPHFLKRPTEFVNALVNDEFMDHMLPTVITTTASTLQRPARTGDGSYEAAYRVVVSVVARGRTPGETRYLTALYGGAVRRIIDSQRSLGGVVAATAWTAGQLAPLDDVTGSGRYLAASVNEFEVWVDQALQTADAPFLPVPGDYPYTPPDPENDPDRPLADPLTVQDVNVTTSLTSPGG